MFLFENISDLDRDWYLGCDGEITGCIPKFLLQWISNYQITGIQFLFENFKNKRNGAILNQDEQMNMQFQVSVFLISLKALISENTPILVICADHLICKWHFNLSQVGFKVQIITSEEFDPGEIFLISSESLKLLEKLADHHLFCVVLDDIDSVVTKKYISRVKGQFHIGLTTRNFYLNPDQKLKWSILNWANPGCVGKLNDFYRIDQLHSLAFADNYKFWWCRLTFKFCDSFEPPLEDEIEEYQEALNKWGDKHGIKTNISKYRTKRKLDVCGKNGEEKTKRRLVKKAKKLEIVEDSNVLGDNQNNGNNLQEEVSSHVIIDKAHPTSKDEIKISKFETCDQESECDDNDILKMFNTSNEVKAEEESCDDPIISIICSQKSDETIVQLSPRSNSNESEFFGNLVKPKSKQFESQRSQEISKLIDNLSDEDNSNGSDGDFFSDLISG